MPYLLKDDLAPKSPTIGPHDIRWEEPDCLLCGRRNWQTLVEAPDVQGGTGLWFAVVQCLECGLCFTNPRPTASWLEQFYPKDYRPHLSKPARRRRWPWLHFWQDRHGIPWHGLGRLLDFGCGGGDFLCRMRDLGWQVTGVDASHSTVRRLQRDLGLHVLHGTLPHPDLEAGSFDVVTMWHSLEHVPDPRAVLLEARRLLTPDGKLYVAVPNIDSLAFRIFGPHWFALDLPRHLVHFSPQTLQFLLEQAGFRVVSMRMQRRSAWIRHSARLAARQPEATWWHRLLRGHLCSRGAALYSVLTGQSDCMTAVAVPLEG
ncbi:MAG: class I SAM-dependent methyltransferase [Gemmatales bacterium]|nr:class I SAM-dependent methyltransferase [Gemmatales bacterium]MDW8386223.1 class I SAM-dependent methyltransferase [Gemmatales bacterium]